MAHLSEFFYFTVIDEDEPINTPSIKNGTVDNGMGYILMWYISEEPILNQKTIITLPYPKTMPRYILWDNDLTEPDTLRRYYATNDYTLYKTVLLSEDEYWVMVDTEFVHTDNPVRFNSDSEESDETESESESYTYISTSISDDYDCYCDYDDSYDSE